MVELIRKTVCVTCGSTVGLYSSNEGTSSYVLLDRLFVNESRTLLVRIWGSGRVEVARRESPEDVWGPPVVLEEERLGPAIEEEQ